MTTATQGLTIHVVAKRDVYDTRRCARCKKPCAQLDVVATDGRLVTHVQCLTQRAASTLPPVNPDTCCWFEHCIIDAVQDNLCQAHHAILYGVSVKKRGARS